MSGVEGRVGPVSIDREYSRRNFLKTAAWTGAALSAMGIGGVAVCRAQAQDQPYKTYQGLGDATILQFAYQLELLEGNFYAIGADSGRVATTRRSFSSANRASSMNFGFALILREDGPHEVSFGYSAARG